MDEKNWLWSKKDVMGWIVMRKDMLGPLICRHDGNKAPLFRWFEDRKDADNYWNALLDDTREATIVAECSLEQVLDNLPLIQVNLPNLSFLALFKENVPQKLRTDNGFLSTDDGTVHKRELLTTSMLPDRN